jgi:hypothetical protein
MHGINLRNTREGHMGTMGIRYGTFGKEFEVEKRKISNKPGTHWGHRKEHFIGNKSLNSIAFQKDRNMHSKTQRGL